MRHYAIVTGTSKGLGKSVASLFLGVGIHVIGISRKENQALATVAKENNVTYQHFNADLGDRKEVDHVLSKIRKQLFAGDIETLYIVNNAAVIEPIAQAVHINPEELAYHYQVNVIAPMTIMNHLLNDATERDITCIGVTITSGAAERAVYGWSAYCSSKASINAYTKTVALEQVEQGTGNKVIAFSPGIMDTDMQVNIRASDPESFKEVETFKRYKENKVLQDAHVVAEILIDILRDESTIENGKIYSVSDYLS